MKKKIKNEAFRPALLGLALATCMTGALVQEVLAAPAPLGTHAAALPADILIQLRPNTALTASLVYAFDRAAGVTLRVTRNLGAGSYLLHPVRAESALAMQQIARRLQMNPSVLTASLYQPAAPQYVVSPNGQSITLNPTTLQKNTVPIRQYRWQQFLGPRVSLAMNRKTAQLTFATPQTIRRNDASATSPTGTTSPPGTTSPTGTTTGTPASSPGVNPGDLTAPPSDCSNAGAPNFAFYHAFSAAFHIIDATGNLRDLSLAATQTTISMADHEVAVNGDAKDFSFSGAPSAISGTIHLAPAAGGTVDATFEGNPSFATGTYHAVDANGTPHDNTFHTNFTGMLGDVAPYATNKNGFLCTPSQTPANSTLVPGPIDTTGGTAPAPSSGSSPTATGTTDPAAGQPVASSAPTATATPVASSSLHRKITAAAARRTVQPSTILGFRLIETDKAGVAHVTNVYVRVHQPSSTIKRVQ
jgi:hypothetical protein